MSSELVHSQKSHIFIVEDDKGRRKIKLHDETYTMGRSQKCDIILHSPFVSRHHATLIRHFNQKEESLYYEIIDGDGKGNLSSNGVLINDEKIHHQVLKHGDKLIFGPQILGFYRSFRNNTDSYITSDDPYDITLIDPNMVTNDLENIEDIEDIN